MKVFKRISCMFLIFILFLQAGIPENVFAAAYPPQPPLENLEVTGIGMDKSDAAAAKCYVDLKWPQLQSPVGVGTVDKYINFYVQEINKPYKPSRGIVLHERDVPGNTTSFRMKGLAPGTFYYINAKAYYTYQDGNITYTSPESSVSKTVKVLTDIELGVASYGTNEIKIEWDDVWDAGKRIDYKLYVSDNAQFANTLPIYIGQAQIGPDGPVKVNQTTGRLEYIHHVSDPGRVYYVKLVPDITQDGLTLNPSTETLQVSSYILVKTTKMSETEAGTIWRLDWSPVVTGLNSSGIEVTYQIDKYVNGVPVPMMLESGTSTYITVPPGGENNYYIIRAYVTKNGVPLYPDNVKIVSDKILVKDSDVPSVPPSPELVSEFRDAYGKLIISYSDQVEDGKVFKGELTPDSATILWRAPKKADGKVDYDTTYDMWVVTDPNLIDNPPESSKVTLKLSEQNYVMDGQNHTGYKYKLQNLTPNSTYYVKLVAKKTFVVFEDGVLKNDEKTSAPSLKVVITPAGGAIDQPLVPGRPPLKILPGSIKNNEVTIQLKNKWYERFVDGKWIYIDPMGTMNDSNYSDDQIRENFKLLGEDKLTGDAYRNFTKYYRIVKYDSGVTIDVGCEEYQEGMPLGELYNMPAGKVTGFSVTANDSTEDESQNLDKQKHNVNINITGLDPNTTYIIWARAARQSVDLISGPSDPVLVTTNPDDSQQVEKPVVPTINYYQAGDTYVDLGWDLRANYKYYIKYSTEDNINSAGESVTITTEELLNSGLSYLRINGLKSNTLYYFWIQAEAVNGELTNKSEWSDSYLVKTLQDMPPSTPKGFGVKNADGAVTKNSITFEWIKEGNLEYILEIAGGTDYKDVKEYKLGNISEYKVDNLRSNFRYFARLYAYNPANKLKSQPTQSVTVRTSRSNDDYDSDQNIEDIVSGDYIVKDPAVIRNTWTIRIIGVNADRFIEHVRNDRIIDYRLDASKPPAKAEKINILISNKVFNALSGLKENLIIMTSGSYLVIRPDVLTDGLVNLPKNEFNYEISITAPDTTANINIRNMTLKTAVTKIDVAAYDGNNPIQVKRLNKPMKVVYPYSGSTWYSESVTSAILYDEELEIWKKVDTFNSYDVDNNEGRVSFELAAAGRMAVADSGTDYYDDIRGSKYGDAIANVASVHQLKSVQGRMFEPGKNATLADAVKLALDVYDYDYGSDYMAAAVKAGLLNKSDAAGGLGKCTREKAAAMVVRLYELKTGETVSSKVNGQALYSDMKSVSGVLMEKVAFAIENGIVQGRNSYTFGPGDTITRGEFAGMLEKLLALLGEID